MLAVLLIAANVTLSGVAPQLLIPAAASAPGANGTYFRSDITIVNFNHSDQKLELQWIAQRGGVPKTTTTIIHERQTIRSRDFVNTFFGIEGLGSLLITGVTADGSPDPNASLWACSRVWTEVPNGEGTVSQGMEPVPTTTLPSTSTALFGLLRDAEHRVNVGVVNLEDQQQIFWIGVKTPGLSTRSESYFLIVPPMSMNQITLTRLSAPIEYVLVSGDQRRWFTYGSSIDNTTGSAWTEYPMAVVPP